MLMNMLEFRAYRSHAIHKPLALAKNSISQLYCKSVEELVKLPIPVQEVLDGNSGCCLSNKVSDTGDILSLNPWRYLFAAASTCSSIVLFQFLHL